MPGLVWINGELSPIESAKVSVADHAFLYGDGVFEGIRIYHHQVFKLDEHLDRLYASCRYLQYEMKVSQAELRAIVLDTARQAGLSFGYVRINVTRGTGLGLDPKNIDRTPNVMVMVSTLSLYPPEAFENGLDVITCSIRTYPPDTIEPRLKCIGKYASNILAKMEANRRGAGEGLMLNHAGEVAECTGDNIFLVADGKVRTPHTSSGILNGVTRQTVIALARKDGIEVVEETLVPFDIWEADEAFLTGTAAEVIPMVTLDGQAIGCGKPGPITRRLMELYREETKNGVGF